MVVKWLSVCGMGECRWGDGVVVRVASKVVVNVLSVIVGNSELRSLRQMPCRYICREVRCGGLVGCVWQCGDG